MKYLLLLYSDQSRWAGLGDEEQAALRAEEMPRWNEYFGWLAEHVAEVEGHELDGADTARTVRVRDGERLVTDGPFAETKEQLGGLFALECESLDEAIEAASRVPLARTGSVEIRAVAPS